MTNKHIIPSDFALALSLGTYVFLAYFNADPCCCKCCTVETNNEDPQVLWECFDCIMVSGCLCLVLSYLVPF